MDPEDDRDQQDRRDGHPWEPVLDRSPFGHLSRRGARDPDECVALAELGRGEARGLALLLEEPGDRRVEEDVVHDRRAVLPRGRDDVLGVREREDELDRAELAVVRGLGPVAGPLERVVGEPARIALDDLRLRRQRRIEELSRPPLGGKRGRVLRNEPEERGLLPGLLKARQVDDHRDRRDDPAEQDRPAQAHDQRATKRLTNTSPAARIQSPHQWPGKTCADGFDAATDLAGAAHKRPRSPYFRSESLTDAKRLADSRRLEADDGARTHDPQLGKLMLYQLSYVRAGVILPRDSRNPWDPRQ